MTDPGILAAIALLLPATSFLILALGYPLRRSGRAAGLVSILCAAGALAAALRAWSLETPEGMTRIAYEWIPQEAGSLATVGVLADADSTIMLVLVALVSLLVQVYSLGYLDAEPRPALGRYYTYQSLFAFSMMGLVLAPG
ncbi:MAG TPA: NADH-quinone oxidoreductase subunit L, partial [Methylomirabilota bacterium]|nr:NADH-quinone oxidoreductase subunit L [Methylomirabilota bacterium]